MFRIWTIHKFTLLQLVCLLVLGVVEVTPLEILFPLVLVLLVPVRILAGRFFTAEELAALDSDEETETKLAQIPIVPDSAEVRRLPVGDRYVSPSP